MGTSFNDAFHDPTQESADDGCDDEVTAVRRGMDEVRLGALKNS